MVSITNPVSVCVDKLPALSTAEIVSEADHESVQLQSTLFPLVCTQFQVLI